MYRIVRILVAVAASIPALSQQQAVLAGPRMGDSVARTSPFMQRVRTQPPKRTGVFTNLDSALQHVDSVEVLMLRGKGLTILPPQVAQMKRLRVIDLSGNLLTTFPSELLKIQSIMSMDLSDNKFTAVPEGISVLKNLVRLSLRNTGITSLPTSVGDCKELAFLDVSHNPLASLPVKELNLLTKLKTITLGMQTDVEVKR